MSGDAWITVTVLVLAFGLLVADRLAPSAVILSATVTLLLADVLTVPQALSGFSNPAPITVATLYVVARAAQKTGMLRAVTAKLLGTGETRRDLARLLVPTAAASSLLNNTPLVAMMVPDIVATSTRRGLSASRYLLPLSFASILGGTMTVLGTSTNLVVSGLLQDQTGRELGLFEVTPIGGPVAVVGLVMLVTLAWTLLPDRMTAEEQASDEVREFVVTKEVVPGGPLDGRVLGETDLVDGAHLFIVQVTRSGQEISPVDPTMVLEGGDRLAFVGRADQVAGLYRVPGLGSSAREHLEAIATPGHGLHVAVVGRNSPLAGHTLADVDFATRYQAAVLAIHRDGHRLTEEPRDVRVHAGDTLMVLADDSFPLVWGERRDFLLVAAAGGDPPQASARAPMVAAITVAMVVTAAFGWLSILEAALVAAGALVATRTLTAREVREAIDLDVVVLIAASFGLGAAMESTGLAQMVADALVGTFSPLGLAGVVFGLLLAVSLLTELVTNNAAVVVVFPIAASLATTTGLGLRTLAVAVAVAASSSFLTPIGYQTNTMVYGPGGYRFTDYLRLGVPLNLLVVATITTLVVAGA